MARKRIIEARVRQKTDTLEVWMNNDLPLLDGEQAFIRSDVDGEVIGFKLASEGKRFSELPYPDFTVRGKVSTSSSWNGRQSGLYIPTSNGVYNGVSVNLTEGYQVLYWDGSTIEKVVYPAEYNTAVFGGAIDSTKDLSTPPTEPTWYIASPGSYNTVPPITLTENSILTWDGTQWSHIPFELEVRGEFLIADNIQEVRNITPQVAQTLVNGTYKAVQVLGYYQPGDTPSPINYYVSNTIQDDDGGSVIETGGIKLEHKFLSDFDIIYFGNNFINSCNYSNTNNVGIILTSNVEISAEEVTPIMVPSGIKSPLKNSLTINGGYYFDFSTATGAVSEVQLDNINITTSGLNATEENNTQPLRLFDYSDIGNSSIVSVVTNNIDYTGVVGVVDGSVRARGLFNAIGLIRSTSTNMNLNNVDIGITIRQSSNALFRNVNFTNTTTGIFGDGVDNCITDGCSLINTVEQANHWRGRVAGFDLNGKDLIYATGNNIQVLNCRAINPIERLNYLIADNTVTRGNYSRNGDGFKSVGSSGENGRRYNILMDGNVLELDDNISNLPITNPTFAQLYYVQNVTIKNNTVRFVGSNQINNSLRIFARVANRDCEDVVVENNYCEKVAQGLVRVELKSPSEVAVNPLHCIKGLKIYNNTFGIGGSAVVGSIFNTDRASGYDNTVIQYSNVEMVGNSFSVLNDPEVSPEFLFDFTCGENMKSSSNRVVSGDFRYAHGFLNAVPPTYSNIQILESELYCRNINSNIIRMRDFIVNQGSNLIFTLLSSPDSIKWSGTNSLTPLGVSGKCEVFKKTSSSQVLDIGPTRQVLIENDCKGDPYTLTRLLSGSFTDVIGVRDPVRLSWSSNNLTINTSSVVGNVDVKVTVLN